MSTPLGAARPASAARTSLGVVWTVIFLDLVGFGIVLPSMAYFVRAFPIPPAAQRFGDALGLVDVAPLFVGAIQTAYSLCQLVFAPLWGRLSDRVGRRPVLVATMAGFSIAWTMFAFAPSMWWLLFARALAGAFGANVSTAQAYVADVSPPAERARGMGFIGMAFGIGFVLGPALGALLSSDAVLSTLYGTSPEALLRGRLVVPGLFAAAFSALAFFVALFALRESLPKEARVAHAGAPSQRAALGDALKEPGIAPMLAVYFVVVAGFANMESMFSQFNLDHLKLPQSTNGLVFTLIGLVLAAVQGGLIGRLTSRLGSARVLEIGLAGLALVMIAFGLQTRINPGLPPVLWLTLLAGATSAFFSLCNPSILAIISTRAKASGQGGTMGFSASAASLGRILGPVLGGAIFGALGPEWPFVFGGGLIGAGLVIFRVRGRA
ncbi:MFS transporter [Myxococcota bacterium]|nr:MFS transporter [Myxococcota bacterium]